MDKDTIFALTALDKKHIDVLFPGFLEGCEDDQMCRKIYNMLDNMHLCGSFHGIRCFPIDGAPALWLKVLSQPRSSRVQMLKKRFIRNIENKLYVVEKLIQKQNENPTIKLSLALALSDEIVIVEHAQDGFNTKRLTKETTIGWKEDQMKRAEDTIDAVVNSCSSDNEETVENDTGEKSPKANEADADPETISETNEPVAGKVDNDMTDLVDRIEYVGQEEEDHAASLISEKINTDEICSDAEVASGYDDQEEEEEEESSEFDASSQSSRILENQSGVSFPIQCPSQATLSLGGLDDTPTANIVFNVKKEVVDDSYDNALGPLSGETQPSATDDVADEMNLQISSVQSAAPAITNDPHLSASHQPTLPLAVLNDESQPTTSDADETSSGLTLVQDSDILIPETINHIPMESENSADVPIKATKKYHIIRPRFFCVSHQEEHPWKEKRSKNRYVCFIEGEGQCHFKYMTCLRKDIAYHRRNFHPPGTKFITDKVECRKLAREVTRVSELMNGIRKTQADQPEEIAPKPPKPNPKLLYRLSDKEILEGGSRRRLYYCCDCEAVHDSCVVEYFECRLDFKFEYTAEPCIFNFGACTREAVDRHRYIHHGTMSSRYRSRKLKHSKLDDNPKRPHNLPSTSALSKQSRVYGGDVSVMTNWSSHTLQAQAGRPTKSTAGIASSSTSTSSTSSYTSKSSSNPDKSVKKRKEESASKAKDDKKIYYPSKVMKCTHCDQFFCESQSEMDLHLETDHPDVPPQICEDCGKALGSAHTIKFTCTWGGCGFHTCSKNMFDTHVKLSMHKQVAVVTTIDFDHQRKIMENALKTFDASQWEIDENGQAKILRPTTLTVTDGYHHCPLCDFKTNLGFRSMCSHANIHNVGLIKVMFSPKLFDDNHEKDTISYPSADSVKKDDSCELGDSKDRVQPSVQEAVLSRARQVELQLELMQNALEKFDSSQWEFVDDEEQTSIFRPTSVKVVDGYFLCPLCEYRTQAGFYAMSAHAKIHHVGPFKVKFSSKLFERSGGTKLPKKLVGKCRGDNCPAKSVKGDELIDGKCQMHLISFHMRHTSKPIEGMKFYCCPFCDYMQASLNRQNLYSHIHEHGSTCQLCSLPLSSSHMYGCAIKKQDDKHYVICSNHREMTHQIVIRKFKVGRSIATKLPPANEALELFMDIDQVISSAPVTVDPKPAIPETAEGSKSSPFVAPADLPIKSEPVDFDDAVSSDSISDTKVRRSTRLTSLQSEIEAKSADAYPNDPTQTGYYPDLDPLCTISFSGSREELRSDDEHVVEEPQDIDCESEDGSEESAGEKNPTANFFAIEDEKNPYQCYFCSFTADESTKMSHHLLNAHVDQQQYNCKLCSTQASTRFKASRKANWSAHMKTVHGVCTHMLETGKTDLTSHSLDTNQMIELAEADEIVPCASCAFKQAEDRREFKRKRLRSGNKRRAKRQKMAISGVKGSRDSEGEEEMNSDEEDNETSSEDGNSENETASPEESESEEESPDDDDSDYEDERIVKRGRPHKPPSPPPSPSPPKPRKHPITLSTKGLQVLVRPRKEYQSFVVPDSNVSTKKVFSKTEPTILGKKSIVSGDQLYRGGGSYYLKSGDGKLYRVMPSQTSKLSIPVNFSLPSPVIVSNAIPVSMSNAAINTLVTASNAPIKAPVTASNAPIKAPVTASNAPIKTPVKILPNPFSPRPQAQSIVRRHLSVPVKFAPTSVDTPVVLTRQAGGITSPVCLVQNTKHTATNHVIRKGQEWTQIVKNNPVLADTRTTVIRTSQDSNTVVVVASPATRQPISETLKSTFKTSAKSTKRLPDARPAASNQASVNKIVSNKATILPAASTASHQLVKIANSVVASKATNIEIARISDQKIVNSDDGAVDPNKSPENKELHMEQKEDIQSSVNSSYDDFDQSVTHHANDDFITCE